MRLGEDDLFSIDSCCVKRRNRCRSLNDQNKYQLNIHKNPVSLQSHGFYYPIRFYDERKRRKREKEEKVNGEREHHRTICKWVNKPKKRRTRHKKRNLRIIRKKYSYEYPESITFMIFFLASMDLNAFLYCLQVVSQKNEAFTQQFRRIKSNAEFISFAQLTELVGEKKVN